MNSNLLLAKMREAAEKILREPGNQTVEAVNLAEHVTELDEKLMAHPDFPRDWIPF